MENQMKQFVCSSKIMGIGQSTGTWGSVMCERTGTYATAGTYVSTHGVLKVQMQARAAVGQT